jgi:glycosyltransferase involved in cell wall biosynthesis
MALGLVPVVVDYGGPGEHVSPASGFAVPLGRRDEIVARLRAVLEALVRDPSVLGPMGRAARERVRRHFTWQAKAEQVLEVYRWVTGRRADKPDFGLPLRD